MGEVLAGEGELGDAGAGQLGQQLTNHSSASSHGPITAHLVQLRPRQLRVVQVEVLGAGDGRHQRGRAHLQCDDMTRTLALVSTLTSARGTESRLRVVILCTEARARSTASSWSRLRWQYLATWRHGNMVTTCPGTSWHTSSRSS